MKVQVTLVVNVDINRSDYVMEETSTDDDVREYLRKQIDDGEVSVDDLIEQGTDYTVMVAEGSE